MDSKLTVRRRATRRRFVQLAGGLAAFAAVGRAAQPIRAAEGTTTLLAVGIDAIPADPFAWRLVRDTAPEFGSGETLERALGFVYSPGGRLRLTADAANGSGFVFPGRAAFIPEAIFQRQESMEGGPLSYLRVGLVVPEGAAYSAGGEVLFDSDGGTLRFAAPPGRRAIRLFRVDLPPNGEVPLPMSDAPMLLHVLDGEAGGGTSGGGDPTPLSAGRTVVAGRDGQNTNDAVIWSGAGAMLLLAVIGEEVPAGGAGRISFGIFDCPGGSGTCDLSSDFALSLEGEGISLTRADLISNEGDMVTPDLPFGTYTLSLANDYRIELNPLDEGTLGPPDGNTQLYYPITLTPANPTVGMLLYRGL